MMFVAEAFAGWLVGQVADAARKRMSTWLFGSDQERALQLAATGAIQATARKFRPEATSPDDPQGAEHLARVIDQVFQQPPTPAESLTEHSTVLQGLRAGVVARLAILADARITGTGESSAELLGVSAQAVAGQLLNQLLREIIVLGARGGPLLPLADQLNHDLTHLQGQHTNTTLEQLVTDQQSMLAILDRLDQRASSLPATSALPLGRPVHEWTDPFALEVHRAIDVPGRAAPLPELPEYVEREHDRQLRAIVDQAAEGRSMTAVLVGGSSTGKTRACWEAVQKLPHDWRLWHPIDPGRPEAAADALPAAGPRTVIWLNDAHHYLHPPASRLGERVAAGLRALLRDPERGPVLLLGTIWPEDWALLTTPPAPGQQDPHAQARALLTGTYIPVPDAFTGSALRTVQAKGGTDPRLAEAAARAEDGRITQFLAGAPALLERYYTAPATAKALIEAAMDARRLGHGLYLPQGLLQAAAPGYLTDQQWDELADNWLERGLAYCDELLRGAQKALTCVHPRSGQPASAQPHYRLADYLEQTGRSIRHTALAPAALWDALVKYADEQDLRRIAEEAEMRSLFRHAFRLYQRAADAGDAYAMSRVAERFEQASQLDEAIDYYQRAADGGYSYALGRVAECLEQAGRVDEAISYYKRAADADDSEALRLAAQLLERAGHTEEAMDWLQIHADAGNSYAMRLLAERLEQAGQLDEALAHYQRAADAGEPHSLRMAAQLLAQAGRVDEAVAFYQRIAEAGDRSAKRGAIRLLIEAGRRDEAIRTYQDAAEAGDPFAKRGAIQLLIEAGRRDEAIDWLRTRAEAGDPDALGQGAEVLAEADRIDEAISWLRVGADAGDSFAVYQMVELLIEAGRRDEVIGLYQHAAEAGDPEALGRAAELLAEADRIDEAINWLQARADVGDTFALEQLAKLLIEAGRRDEAIDIYDEAISFYRRSAESGDSYALEHLPELLKEAGRTDEAISWLQAHADMGDSFALEYMVELLTAAGRRDEAIGIYQHAAEAGNHEALGRAAELLAEADRIDEAINWLLTCAQARDQTALRQAAETLSAADRLDEAVHLLQTHADVGDANALSHAAELLAKAGRVDEAISIYQHATELGEPHALRWTARLLEGADRRDEAAQLRQYGLEPGGHIAHEWR